MQGGKDDAFYKAKALEGLKRLKQLEVSSSWANNGDKPCKMFKMEIDGRVASKGIDKVPYNIEKVIAFLDKEDSLKIINNMLTEIKVLKVVEGDFRINYMRYKGIWPVDDRDFVNVSTKQRVNEKKLYISTIGCDFEGAPQVPKGVVRGEVYVGGYIIEWISENQTQVTYVSDADLKGSIPGMVKNTLSAKQGQIASRVAGGIAKSSS